MSVPRRVTGCMARLNMATERGAADAARAGKNGPPPFFPLTANEGGDIRMPKRRKTEVHRLTISAFLSCMGRGSVNDQILSRNDRKAIRNR